MTLPFENIIVLCIIFVMMVVLFFSFGVEKGKRLAKVVKSQETADVQTVIAGSDSSGNKSDFLQTVKSVSDKKSAVDVNRQQKAMQGERQLPKKILEIASEIPKNEEDVFTVQVASFKLKKNARREAANLREMGYDVFVLEKGNYSIVCVGKFAQRDKAKEFFNKLKAQYRDCLVRRL